MGIGDVIRFGKVVVRIKEIHNSNEVSRYNSHLDESKQHDQEIQESPPAVFEDSKGEQEFIVPQTLVDEESKCEGTMRTISSRADTIMDLGGRTPKETAAVDDAIEVESPTCRICLSEDQEKENPMISPCKCDGTMKYIHYLCLKEWLQSSR